MQRYRVQPGTDIRLQDWDPNDHSGFDGDKDDGEKELGKLGQRLADLQQVLYAEHKHKVLVVLQAMDTGGKDGTIQHVFHGVNPEGLHVANFKQPTRIQLDHDYLWRVHQEVPGKGELTIFNRSHYEDVLIVRVHNLVPREVWSRRYAQINDFERMLTEEGTSIVKFYLNIDRDEQKKRLQARLDDRNKLWKFNPEDLKERERWDDYMAAYQDILSMTSTEYAPWYIVPANHKWYSHIVVARVLVDLLESLHLEYPRPNFDPDEIDIK